MSEPANKAVPPSDPGAARSEWTQAQVLEYENYVRDINSTKAGDVLHNSINQEDGMLTGTWDDEVKAFVDAQTLKFLFFAEDWVYIVVDLVAMKISSRPLRVMRGKVDEESGEYTTEPAEGHPLQDLIDQPNPYQSYASWMYSLIVDLTLIGNSTVWHASSANMLMNLPIESVTLDLSNEGQLESYTVTEVSNQEGMIQAKSQTKFKAEDVIHSRRPNPSSLLWGLSPFVPGRKSVLFNRYSTDYLISFYQKGAIPGFALQMDKEANEKVALRLMRSFENAYTGRRNMRRTMVLPKGVSVKEMSHTLANQELATYIDKNRENIINLLKVPKHELSLAESGSLGSEEAKMALRNFWYATLIPLMKIVEGDQTKFFRAKGLLGEDEFVEFQIDDIEALQEDQAAKADLATKYLAAGWTLNEVRTEVWKKPRYENVDADRPFVIKPLAPTFGPAPSLGASAPSAPAAPALLPATGTAAADGNGLGLAAGADESKEASSVVSAKASKDSLAAFLKSGDGWFDKREQKIRADASKGQTQMEAASLRLFADMAATIIRVTRGFLKEKGWDDHRTKAEDERAKLIKKNELRRRLRKAMDKFEERWVDDSRKALIARVETGYGVALEIPFNLPSPTEIEGLRARGAAARQDALEERSGRVFRYMNETTIESVFSTIENGIEQGKTVQEIAGDLKTRFSNVEEIGSRAMTIARTETLTAVSLGQAAAMADAAKLVPNLQKMWISADDERTRESHVELHGDVVAHDKEFNNGLQFPRDPVGPPSEVINCRCTWVMVPAEQMSQIDPGLAADETKE